MVSHHRLVRPAPVSEYGVLYSDRGVDDTIFGAFDGDSLGGVRRGLSRQPGFVHRQHRLPGDPRGLRQPRSRRDVVDSQWLHHRVRRLSQPRRPARRPLWASPRLPVRSGRVHRGVGRLRVVGVVRHVGRRPGRSGPRRGDADAQFARVADGRRSRVTARPPVGGMLVELSWRWIFFVNIPLVLAALVTGPWVLSDTKRPGRGFPICWVR